MMQMPTTRTLVVDDHPVVRETFGLVLETEPAITVVGEAANGREALDQITATQPDVVILDVAMPGLDGMEVTRRVVDGPQECAVVILTANEESHCALQSFEAGASAYVLKRTMARDLLPAVRCARDGGRYVSPALHAGPEGTAL